MKLTLASDITSSIPGIRLGVIVITDLHNERKISTVEQLLRGVWAQKKSQWKNEDAFKHVTDLLEAAKPQGFSLPSLQLFESNIKKIQRNKELTTKNTLYTLLHYLSVKHNTPIQAYDLDQQAKDIEIDFITAKKGQRPPDFALSRETKNIVVWMLDIGSCGKEEFQQLPEVFAAEINKYCSGAEPSIHMLSADNPQLDLGYTSPKEGLALESPDTEPAAPEVATKVDKVDEVEPPFAEHTPAVPSVQPCIKDELAAAINEQVSSWLATQDFSEPLPGVELETPADSAHGDYASNIALKLSKLLGRPPREIADQLSVQLQGLPNVEKVEVAGPGFINFYLTPSYFQEQLDAILSQKANYGRSAFGQNKKVLIEYSAPNIAKPLGVHHLLSTIIGQVLADLYRFSGHRVVAINYPGDWGTQFGKLLYAYKTWGNEETVKKDPLNELLKLYVQFHEEAKQDSSLEDRGRAEFKKLEEGDPECVQLWEWMKKLSLEEIKRMYKILGVSFDEYLSESMYLEPAKLLLQEGRERGVFTVGEQGALVVTFEGEKFPPYIVQKADGTTLYATRDLASIRHRLAEYHPDQLIYVVDVAQKLHFEQLFATAVLLGMDQAQLTHVSFGRMQFADGKMSSREGQFIPLDDLIEEAKTRAQAIVEQKSPDFSAEEKAHIVNGMAIGAIKYNILSQNRETNLTFDWDRMLSLDGNSGPYLQYTYARARSIERKAAKTEEAPKEQKEKSLQTTLYSIVEDRQVVEAPEPLNPYEHPTEQVLLRILSRFPEKIELAVQDYKPNVITTYLFDLAKAFNSFYHEAPVLTAPTPELKATRLKLVSATAQVLQNGLKLLGIEAFERM